jgi:hypothetical protein
MTQHMNEELTRLRAICNALLEYDEHDTQAAIKWAGANACPECWDEAEKQEGLANEALERAIRLTRKEQS